MPEAGNGSARGGARAIAIVAVLLLLPGVVRAQAVVDAGTAEFIPSSHHSQLAPDGRAIVASYQMQVFAAGTTQLIRTLDIGKPSPQVDGRVRVHFLGLLNPPLAAGVQYQARVVAVGPGGTAPSELSNAFSYSGSQGTGSCNIAVSPSSLSAPATGLSGTFSITAGAGCTWDVAGVPSWIIVQGGTRTGSGTMTFTIEPNATVARTASILVAGRSVAVSQPAPLPAPRNLRVMPPRQTKKQ